MRRAGRYTIRGRLGRGGMSTVYKACAPVTGRIVALKILKPRDEIFEDLVGAIRLREMFVEEARIMGAISHDHVAKVIDCDEHEGAPFIVLEYFSHSIGDVIGEAYREEQPSRIVSVPRAFLYIDQALKGLERLHFAGIIHRDIKPFNLMITNDDRVKMIDFGLSRVRGEEQVAVPGMQVGSPYYAAPEQRVDPEKADERSDIFSIGVLLYRLLTGRLINPGKEAPAKVSTINRELTPAWDGLLDTALAIRPEKRFGSALTMRLALQEVYEKWQSVSKESCPLEPPCIYPEGLKLQPRSEPIRVMYKDMREELALDELFRPLRFHEHGLTVIDQLLLQDPLTGLYWQRSGSGFSLDWQQAKEYILYLNKSRFAGRDNWRLPTSQELVTVLRSPTTYRDFCLDPHFEPTLHWLWSADYCTKKTAWMADIIESHIARLDKDGSASVCAVSG